eukprot:6172280-Pleurochrysis_carterae.AAC.2
MIITGSSGNCVLFAWSLVGVQDCNESILKVTGIHAVRGNCVSQTAAEEVQVGRNMTIHRNDRKNRGYVVSSY